MIFTEFRFLFFFALVFLGYWGLQSNRGRKLWLLVASYLFYAAWDWRFLGLIVLSSLVDYVVALRLGAVAERRRRRLWMALSLAVNLGMLGFFKYFNFFAESAAELLAFLGLPASPRTLAIILPVGISFYTFQTLSYSLDVFHRKLEPRHSLLDVALFVAFFPQLVAGPILRAKQFLPQLDTPRLFADVKLRRWTVLFLVGFFKKACIGDNLGTMVDHYFASPFAFDAVSSWIAALGFSIQIYCDFSGYSDMAIACGGLLGYRMPDNFDFPYFARSVQELWHRWHISLSTWLRDYLYIPLGGSRSASARVVVNLVLTFLLGGLWHGAAWSFVVWGGLHGAALAARRSWSRQPRIPRALRRFFGVLGCPLTFYWWTFTMILFRAENIGDGAAIWRAFVLWQDLGPERLPPRLLGLYAILAIIHWFNYRGWPAAAWRRAPAWAFAGAYGAAAAVALALMHRGAEPFIYFQF